MLAVNDEVKGIDVDIVLTETERSLLAAYVKTEAFDVLQRLFEDIVKSYNVRLTNTDPVQTAEVLINHTLAHVAGGLYVGLMARLREELQVENYNNRARNAEPENNMQLDGLR
jgi:hypothetical protein